MRYHEAPPTRFANLDHLNGIVKPNRNRLFNEHMLSSFERRDANRFVKLHRQTDVYHVYLLIGEEVFNSVVFPKTGEIFDAAAWAKNFLGWRSNRHQVFSDRER